jgi:hypothetical protein
MNVDTPEDPVVVRTMVFCLLLNVDQSVELKYPLEEAEDCNILNVGLSPPVVCKGDITDRDEMFVENASFIFSKAVWRSSFIFTPMYNRFSPS